MAQWDAESGFLSMGDAEPIDDLQSPSTTFSPDAGAEDTNGEGPLLEELGINVDHIRKKTVNVIVPMKEIPTDIYTDADLAGPLVFGFIMGFFLMLAGKLQFGYIYGFGGLGCFGLYVVFNLMARPKHAGIHLAQVISIMGYSLLPIVAVSGFAVVINFTNIVGGILVFGCTLWCTVIATRFFVKATEMSDARFLIAYPVFLLFACFSLITIF